MKYLTPRPKLTPVHNFQGLQSSNKPDVQVSFEVLTTDKHPFTALGGLIFVIFLKYTLPLLVNSLKERICQFNTHNLMFVVERKSLNNLPHLPLP